MLHIKSPLILSHSLTAKLERPVYLKLENLQPPGSFKIRGIGLTCLQAKQKGCQRLVGSSGGNAGLALAFAAKQLAIPATLFIPKSTPDMMVEKFKEYEETTVVVIGENWNEANDEAMKFLESNPGTFFVHPYDQPSTWNGHATIVHEIHEQLGDVSPGAIVTCVGGGGLAIGILIGMEGIGWNKKIPLITMETEGSNCFNAALKAGQIVTLDGINSIAKSLGALSVSEKLFELAKGPDHYVKSFTVSDEEALEACVEFSKIHRMLVEPACGAALAAVFSNAGNSLEDTEGPIVVVVCGGNMASLELFDQWKQAVMPK